MYTRRKGRGGGDRHTAVPIQHKDMGWGCQRTRRERDTLEDRTDGVDGWEMETQTEHASVLISCLCRVCVYR